MTDSAKIKTKFEELSKLIKGIDSHFESYSEKFNAVLDNFHQEFGHLFDNNTVRRTGLLINLLQEKSLVPFVPRTVLAETALIRKQTKTPPGFKDDLFGDFFVWSDLLLGLAQLKKEMPALDRVVMVTLDRKADWSRNGVPHPILSSEIGAVCGATFEVMTTDLLVDWLLDKNSII